MIIKKIALRSFLAGYTAARAVDEAYVYMRRHGQNIKWHEVAAEVFDLFKQLSAKYSAASEPLGKIFDRYLTCGNIDNIVSNVARETGCSKESLFYAAKLAIDDYDAAAYRAAA